MVNNDNSVKKVDPENEHLVRVHIDRNVYESPNPTTGKALYELGAILGHRELFLENRGDQEDALIPKNDSKIEIKKDDHFYSQKEIKIIVNGREKNTVETKLTFDEVVQLADNLPSGPNTQFTVTYHNGPRQNPEGTMIEGQAVKVKKGMVFHVTATTKS